MLLGSAMFFDENNPKERALSPTMYKCMVEVWCGLLILVIFLIAKMAFLFKEKRTYQTTRTRVI